MIGMIMWAAVAAGPADHEAAVVKTVEKAKPGVVSIRGTLSPQAYGAMMRQHQGHAHGPLPNLPGIRGSGFVYDKRGYVLTNYHVVESSRRLTVVFPDKTRYRPELVGYNERWDLAVLKIEAKEGLPVLPLGDSDRLKQGETALAIGSPMGFAFSVTSGIISATGRLQASTTAHGDVRRIPRLIQTDAPINPGNSGGPLLNLRGEVIGINASIVGQANIGIGFAIPINEVKKRVKELEEGLKTKEGLPWAGIAVDQAKTERKNNEGVDGVVIEEIVEGSPAEETALAAGMLLVKIGDEPVHDVEDFMSILAAHEVGDEISLTAMDGEKAVTVSLTLAEMKKRSSGRPRPEEEPRLEQ